MHRESVLHESPLFSNRGRFEPREGGAATGPSRFDESKPSEIHWRVDIVPKRLSNHRLVRAEMRTPAEVVRWFGAVQAQDYPAAKWALGLRARSITDADVDRAFDAGEIDAAGRISLVLTFGGPLGELEETL